MKQIEQLTGCRVVIRGRGSVKDVEKERRLAMRAGWEHLSEPLHVYIAASRADATSSMVGARVRT